VGDLGRANTDLEAAVLIVTAVPTTVPTTGPAGTCHGNRAVL